MRMRVVAETDVRSGTMAALKIAHFAPIET